MLPLSQYELIVGMDWLSVHSPMEIDWQHKWIILSQDNAKHFLQGELFALPIGSVLRIATVLAEEAATTHSEPHASKIAALLSEFQSVFAPPTGYPPTRPCDHAIPLVLGASPVNVTPYRYSPTVKDEIERQVTEMLKSGVIQPSSNPFSSSVLLVKKKDGSYRFCVDFHHLNAITAKIKYLVPVIEELLDELTHASWYSCLDLTASYHQIRLQPGEEYKTAF